MYQTKPLILQCFSLVRYLTPLLCQRLFFQSRMISTVLLNFITLQMHHLTVFVKP